MAINIWYSYELDWCSQYSLYLGMLKEILVGQFHQVNKMPFLGRRVVLELDQVGTTIELPSRI